jgi:hypothetical protein
MVDNQLLEARTMASRISRIVSKCVRRIVQTLSLQRYPDRRNKPRPSLRARKNISRERYYSISCNKTPFVYTKNQRYDRTVCLNTPFSSARLQDCLKNSFNCEYKGMDQGRVDYQCHRRAGIEVPTDQPRPMTRDTSSGGHHGKGWPPRGFSSPDRRGTLFSNDQPGAMKQKTEIFLRAIMPRSPRALSIDRGITRFRSGGKDLVFLVTFDRRSRPAILGSTRKRNPQEENSKLRGNSARTIENSALFADQRC